MSSEAISDNEQPRKDWRSRAADLLMIAGVTLCGWLCGTALLHFAFKIDATMAAIQSFIVATISLAVSGWGFKSIKTGMVTLSLIGGACVFGTAFYAANDVLGDNAIPLAQQRVFRAPWFFLLLGFFFVQFIISTWHVTVMSLGIWWKKDFRRVDAFYEMGTGRAAIPVPRAELDDITKRLRKMFIRVHRDGDAFFAHKGIQTRLGPTIIHAGIVVILLTGLTRILLDFTGNILSDGRFVAVEGEESSTIFKPIFHDQAMSDSNLTEFKIPYDIRVLDFDVILHPNSQEPAYFSSLVEVTEQNTGKVSVAKLDMNHSYTIGGFQFHQASYGMIPPIQQQRHDFDVRDAETGERIGVTDTVPGVRVQVGDEDLFLEVDGSNAGDAWRLFTSKNPGKAVAEGYLASGKRTEKISMKPVEFFTDFRVKQEDGKMVPYNASTELNNPALRVDVLSDGVKVGETVLFLDEELAAKMPAFDPRYSLQLQDIEVAVGEDGKHITDSPDDFRFIVAMVDADSKNPMAVQKLMIGQPGADIDLQDNEPEILPAADAKFIVQPLGNSMAYFTVLSVVREPVVPFYVGGVLLMAFGAILTFTGRYRAVHGWYDEAGEVLRVAMIPRFGKGPDPAEFEELLRTLQGKGREATKPAKAAVELSTT